MDHAGVANLIEDAEQAISAIEAGETPSEESLMVTCQNLVTWASRFDIERHGPDTHTPSADDRLAAKTAIKTLSLLIEAYESSMESIQDELKEKHHSRRALSGYGCIESTSSHSQFVNRKI